MNKTVEDLQNEVAKLQRMLDEEIFKNKAWKDSYDRLSVNYKFSVGCCQEVERLKKELNSLKSQVAHG